MDALLHPLLLALSLVPVILVVRHLARASTPAAGSNGAAGAASFFARTGYRYADATDMSLQAQEQRALSEGRAVAEGRFSVCYVRHRGELRCEFRQGTFSTSQLAQFPGGAAAARDHGSFHLRGSRGAPATYQLCSWRVTAPRPPRLLLHVAERSLGRLSPSAALAGSRPWRARAPHPVTTHLPALDQRFQIYSSAPEAAVALLRANPEWVTRLLACVEVDLWTDETGAELSDPELHNLFGGRDVRLRVAANPEELLQRMVGNHDRITDLLAELLHAAT